jgi:hypothetical protein
MCNLNKLFGSKHSVYVDRLQTMQIEKALDEDFNHYANRVKVSLHKV